MSKTSPGQERSADISALNVFSSQGQKWASVAGPTLPFIDGFGITDFNR
jgi:hypothetical protein